MPKRQHLGEDDQPSQSSSKRAKTAESDDESEAPTQARHKRERDKKRKGKGRSQAENSGSDSSDEEIDIAGIQEPELDDEEFERIHGDKLRARLERRQKAQGVSFFFYLTLKGGQLTDFLVGCS